LSKKVFFFEKKNQKTFVRCRGLSINARLMKQTFLLLFL